MVCWESEIIYKTFFLLDNVSDLTESDSTRAVSVGLLDTTGGGGRFASGLGGELLAGSFSSGGFTGGLLSTGHCLGSTDE